MKVNFWQVVGFVLIVVGVIGAVLLTPRSTGKHDTVNTSDRPPVTQPAAAQDAATQPAP